MNIIGGHTLRTDLRDVYSIVIFSPSTVYHVSKLDLMHYNEGWVMLVGWWMVVLGGGTGATAGDCPEYE